MIIKSIKITTNQVSTELNNCAEAAEFIKCSDSVILKYCNYNLSHDDKILYKGYLIEYGPEHLKKVLINLMINKDLMKTANNISTDVKFKKFVNICAKDFCRNYKTKTNEKENTEYN